ncbi:MAG: peptidylprolyl isomerase [Flavobacteriaceae bacterium]
MKKFIVVSIVVVICSMGTFAQKSKEVLMTIDGKPIYAKEFKRVYKKNLDLVQDESQKSIDGYLNLFVDYKLKVAEAYAQELNLDKAYVEDFNKYEEQLSRNYIYDFKFTDDISREAYDRSLEEVEVSHILINCSWDAFPQDTLAAYNKIKAMRDRILSGDDFNEMARKSSDDPSVKQNDGNLGYFSAFSMVYPFETAAYNTPVGEISPIVRTQFGYHILKVTGRRKKLPPVTVSHIMITTLKDTTGYSPKERINEIYGLLKQGASFEELAQQYSDDKSTARVGGKLKPFSKGELKAPPFEEAAYQLKTIGEISKPVETRFGWHIIRLDELHTIPSYEEQKKELDEKIKYGDRIKVVTSAINHKIMKRYGFESYEYLPFFEHYVSDSILKRKWTYTPIKESENKVIFKIGKTPYYYSQFAEYISQRQARLKPPKQKRLLIESLYDEFETNSLKEYFKQQLEEENDEYAGIIQEYRDGLLIFEVMSKNVWEKAKADTLGQMAYYNKNMDKYQWKQRVDGAIFSSGQREVLETVENLLQQNITLEDIKKQMNANDTVNVIVTPGVFEIDQKELPQGFEVKKGISKIYESNGTFTLVQVNSIIPSRSKAFDEVKGRVLSDFQNELEKKWMESLHAKYSVEVNKKTLKKIKKELGA